MTMCSTVPFSWAQRGQTVYGNYGEYMGYTMDLSTDGQVLVVGSEDPKWVKDAAGEWEKKAERGIVRAYKWDATTGKWIQRGKEWAGKEAYDYLSTGLAVNADGVRDAPELSTSPPLPSSIAWFSRP